MSFLYPAFLFGALAVALPIALHLLRRDVAPEVPFSAVRLLQRTPVDRNRRRRLRDLLLLAARVAALMLLALAFARPYVSGASPTAGLRIVAIDRSFSMGAPGRFSRAQELAGVAVGEAGLNERIAVIAFDERADVVAPPGSAAEARGALATLRPGFGATRFAPAVARAIEVAGGNPARVVVITDLQRNGWEDEQPLAVPSALQIEVRDAGAPPPNAAVVQVRVEPERVVATVRNNAAATFTGVARIRVDGRDAASSTVSVPPDESADVAIAYRAGARGSLAVSIDDDKGYPADNSRYLVLSPPSRTRVLVITTAGAPQAGLYVARALEAAAVTDDNPFDLRIVSGAEASAIPSVEAGRYGAIVLLSTRGLDRRGRDMLAGFLRGGGGLLVAAGSDVQASVLSSAFGWELGAVEETKPLALSASDVRHPIFRPFGSFAVNLGQIRFERVWKIKAEGWEVAARFTDGSPALVERQHGKGRAMVFASDFDRQWNEFPQHPAFVPFAVEAVRHVAGARERTRDYLVADAPAGARPEPGVYTVQDGRIVAVNVDTRESGGARLTALEFKEMLARLDGVEASKGAREVIQAQNVEARQNLWQYGLVLMLGLLVLESAVGRG